MDYKYHDGTKRAGWDHLYEDCFEGINQIIHENIKGLPHNEILVNEIFKKMLEALHKAKEKINSFVENPYAKPEWSISWDSTFNKILEYSKSANTANKKVITINMIDEFLRSTY
jgi:molecular chaperone DnaK (HSP70)